MKTVANVVASLNFNNMADEALYWHVFDKYFRPEHQEAVHSIFVDIVGTDPTSDTGADSFRNIHVDGDDFGQQNVDGGQGKAPTSYTQNPCDENNQQTKMHFSSSSPNAYAFKSLAEITPRSVAECPNVFGNSVSVKMLSFGGYVVLHEIM